MSVNLTVLHVADCPNLAPMLQRLRQVTDLPVTIREITTDAGASADGMAGSPTLLINGIDPFRTPGSTETNTAIQHRSRRSLNCAPRSPLGQRRPPSPSRSQSWSSQVSYSAPGEPERYRWSQSQKRYTR